MRLKIELFSAVLSVSILCSGCSLVHYISVNERSSEEMIEANNYLLNICGDTSYSYQISNALLDSLSVHTYALNTYKLRHGTSASPVQIRMYNSSGDFLNGWSQCFGSLGRFGLLDSVPMQVIDHLPVNSDLSLQSDLDLFSINEDEKSHILDTIINFDYVITIYWAEWAGWYSKDAIKKVYKYIDSNSEYSILVLKLNTSP